MHNIKLKIQNRAKRIRCYLIRVIQRPIWPKRSMGYLTIFFDYEGDYALTGKERAEASIYGVKRILEICKKHNIRATFNIVGKLFHDHPEIVRQMIKDGHDIASHSFKHDDISTLSRAEIDNDIKLTKQTFETFGLVLRGMRSPQNRWSFKQMDVMLKNGLCWSAEGDPANFPYIIHRKNGKCLVRFPINFGDYNFYISKRITADEMYDMLIETAINIQNAKTFGAVGFHPWVNGQDENRLHAMDKFFAYICKMPDLKVVTFDKAYNLIASHNKWS